MKREEAVMKPEDVKRIRKHFGATQQEFAEQLGYGIATIRRTEKGSELPRSFEKLLDVIEKHPEVFQYFGEAAGESHLEFLHRRIAELEGKLKRITRILEE